MKQLRVLGFAAIVLAVIAVGATGAVTAEAATTNLECEFPVNVTDGTGTEVTVEEPPDEIVVMHASSAQVVHDIGKWDNVTGAPVTPFTAYLDDHDRPTDVTDDEGFPIDEAIVDLDPDIVFAGHVGDVELVEALRVENITVYMGPQPNDVEAIQEKVLIYGSLLDACDGAQERATWMDERLEEIEDMVDDRPLAYYELGEGWTTGSGTFQHDMIERAGADNLGAEADLEGWGQLSEEVVIDLEPDFIVYDESFDAPPVTDAIAETRAVVENRTVGVNANYINQAGPRVVYVIETMAEAFAAGPLEAADDAEPEPEPADDSDDADDSPEDTPTADDDDDPSDAEPTAPTDDDETEALPGFGPIAAAGAVLVVGIVALGRKR